MSDMILERSIFITGSATGDDLDWSLVLKDILAILFTNNGICSVSTTLLKKTVLFFRPFY